MLRPGEIHHALLNCIRVSPIIVPHFPFNWGRGWYLKVERVQYQAALAITGAWQGSSRSKIYDELGWETLSDRRKGRRVLLINKIINNNTPSYLNEKLPPFCREMLSGNINTTFHAIRCKTYRYLSSFFPDAIAS